MQPVTLPPFTTIAAHSTGITTFNFNFQGLISCDSGTLPISFDLFLLGVRKIKTRPDPSKNRPKPIPDLTYVHYPKKTHV
ncbi:hypothetical protein HanXRQr2_Chr01g0006451 [Helianthus annuus]|uniref:Uncharacterized protein n=1 Tax=Helianthus annuus TaxID=4232 RepID=A0A9K3JTB8_HELAN|nr:hypothetical protein HanXRQr2_Chr01g0006451 [Helianthus annuus]